MLLALHFLFPHVTFTLSCYCVGWISIDAFKAPLLDLEEIKVGKDAFIFMATIGHILYHFFDNRVTLQNFGAQSPYNVI
jgi:hypothetical protein